MKKILGLVIALSLAGCATSQNSPTLKQSVKDDLLYRPVIDLRVKQIVSKGETQFVDFDEWLDGALLSESQTKIIGNNQITIEDCLIRVSGQSAINKETLSTRPRTDKITCFNQIPIKARVNHRNALVDIAMAYSQNNCLRRGNLTSNIVTTSDTFVETLMSLAGTAGVAVSDAPSARAAAGAMGILNSFWNNSKSKLLNDSSFSSFNARLAVQRADDAAEILNETNVLKESNIDTSELELNYSTLGLMATVNKINEFDNTCDFFR